MEQAIDLNKEIVKHPASTFYGRLVGDSMKKECRAKPQLHLLDQLAPPQEFQFGDYIFVQMSAIQFDQL